MLALHRRCSWVPGPPLTGRPGMTRGFFSTLLANVEENRP